MKLGGKVFLYKEKTIACRDGAGKKHGNKTKIKIQKTNLKQKDSGEERQEECPTSVSRIPLSM